MTITLYDMPESPHARKVRLLAAELGIPLDCVRCDPRIGETRSPDYLAKNPTAKCRPSSRTTSCSGSRRRSSNISPPSIQNVSWPAPMQSRQLRSISGCSGGAAVRRPPSTRSPGSCSSSRKCSISRATIPGSSPTRICASIASCRCSTSSSDGREFIVGPLSIADFAIGPRFDRAPELLKFDVAPYRNIGAWLTRLRAKPYWGTA